MAIVPSTRPPFLSFRPKLVLVACIGVMLAYVLYHDEHFLIDSTDPEWPHYRDIGRVLLPHGLLGALALVLACMQFSSRIRAQHPLIHRVCGRIYVVVVLAAAPTGAILGRLDQSIGYPSAFAIETATQASLWMLTTLIAFFCIRNGKLEQHRQWMTRSLSIALIFVTDRVVGGLTGWDQDPLTDTTTAWICLALAFPLADTALLVEDLLRSRSKRVNPPETSVGGAPRPV
jgi:uncharacterized membrane protein YozB (DUF420 family)